jgi:hypothetical protein
MVNQQVTYKIAWLAGIWDGEGTISIRQNVKIKQFSPRVHVTNTDMNIINEVRKILNMIGVDPRIHETHGDKYESTFGKKVYYHIGVDTLSKSKIILDTILPYLIGKKAQAECLLAFINSRTARWNKNASNENKKYLPEDIENVCKIYELNGNQRGSSETTRAAFRQLLAN